MLNKTTKLDKNNIAQVYAENLEGPGIPSSDVQRSSYVYGIILGDLLEFDLRERAVVVVLTGAVVVAAALKVQIGRILSAVLKNSTYFILFILIQEKSLFFIFKFFTA